MPPWYGPGSGITHTGAKTRRQEARHFQNRTFRRLGLHMLRSVAQELPEDEELIDYIDAEIPGLSPPIK